MTEGAASPKARPRKTLGSRESPWVQGLSALIAGQDKATVAHWCMDYAQQHVLPVYEGAYPGDDRPRQALDASRAWFRGEMKMAQVKDVILNQCHQAAREKENDPAAQAAARCVGHAAACFHSKRHALGLVFYGTAALAYRQLGLKETREAYEQFAMAECARMEQALLARIAGKERNTMPDYTLAELTQARQALQSTMNKCNAISLYKLPKAQQTLLTRRIRALEIALALIDKEVSQQNSASQNEQSSG